MVITSELVLENLNGLNLNKLKITYQKQVAIFIQNRLYGYALNNSNTPDIKVFTNNTIKLLKGSFFF